jgi:hypothetical protein
LPLRRIKAASVVSSDDPEVTDAHERSFSLISADAAAVAYTALIIYGNLIPFRFQPLSARAEAWAHFREIPYLQLGAGNRADLMANFLLFIPIGFFWSAALSGRRGGPDAGRAGGVRHFAGSRSGDRVCSSFHAAHRFAE